MVVVQTNFVSSVILDLEEQRTWLKALEPPGPSTAAPVDAGGADAEMGACNVPKVGNQLELMVPAVAGATKICNKKVAATTPFFSGEYDVVAGLLLHHAAR